MIAIGFDVGTHRIAMSVPELHFVTEIDHAKHFVGQRDRELRALLKWVESRVAATGVSLAPFIERPFLSGSGARNPNTTIGMAETVGVIRAATVWGQPSVMVNPSTWKKELLEDGRASKDDARRWLSNRMNPEEVIAYSEDMCDATCVALYGAALIEGTISLPQPKTRRRRGQRS